MGEIKEYFGFLPTNMLSITRFSSPFEGTLCKKVCELKLILDGQQYLEITSNQGLPSLNISVCDVYEAGSFNTWISMFSEVSVCTETSALLTGI